MVKSERNFKNLQEFKNIPESKNVQEFTNVQEFKIKQFVLKEKLFVSLSTAVLGEQQEMI